MSNDPFSNKAAEDFLGGNSVPGAKFPKVGSVVEGTILDWVMSQQTDMETGEKKVWSDGRPRMQMALTIQGEVTGKKLVWTGDGFDEEDLDDDDGQRVLFVKGGLQMALKAAIREAKGKLEKGAHIKIVRGKNAPPKVKGQRGASTYTATWTPADQNPKWTAIQAAEGENFLGDGDDDESPF